ncbi:MAG: M56 family metallopeptidase [Lachnospiraceae bacterium]|nr:M56 family metallopeptidase [Lachnospiraceae bacterium]
MAIGVGIVSQYLKKYKKIKGYLRQNAEPVSGQVYNNAIQFNQCRYKVYQCKYVKSPFVIGIIRPAIVLPCRDWNEEELNMVLEHEMIHIQQCDNLIKLLVLVVLALNIYNPLAWYVMYQWNLIAELSCDKKVITGKTKEEIKQYGYLILEIAEHSYGDTKQPIMGLNLQNKMMKERILNMKNGMKRGNILQKVIGAGIMGIAVFSSSLTVLAYSPKTILYSDKIADKFYFSEEDIMWGNDDVNLPVNECGGWVFFNDEWEVIAVVDELNHDAEVYSTCVHEYMAGKSTKHTKYADNSCTTEYYEAERCSKCGYIKLGELIDVITRSSCPH